MAKVRHSDGLSSFGLASNMAVATLTRQRVHGALLSMLCRFPEAAAYVVDHCPETQKAGRFV